LNEIENFLKKEKPELFYPVDVTETSSSIGGNISTDASGGRSFYFGSTRNWIKKIKVVLPTGELIEIERGREKVKDGEIEVRGKKVKVSYIKELNVKNNAGYYLKKEMDLIDLFIGNEGTLGIVTETELKLTKRIENLIVLVSFFENEDDALNFFWNLKKLKEIFCIEYFDSNSLNLLKDFFNIPLKGGAIYFETEEENIDEIEELLKNSKSSIENTWAGTEEKEIEKIKDFRHKLPEIINNKIAEVKRVYPEIHKLSTDIAVNEENLSKMIEFYKKVCEEKNLNYVLFGHIGENHLHLNIIPENREEFEKGKDGVDDFVKFAVSLGGTFSAEHGVGKIKKRFMKYLYNEKELKEMVNLKKLLDPNLILGTGNIFEDDLLL
ncbi:MAG: FAD-binding oxidoreductase, partial [Caldiserica bacterium]